MKVAIVVNSNVQDKARPCFWKSTFWKEAFNAEGWNFDYVSIADDIASAKVPPVKLFRLDRSGRRLYDLIIVSWDAINGDPIYLSDIGLRFSLHYSPNLDLWVRRGGVVIVEFQSAAFRLVQEAYNVFNYDYAVGRRIHTIEVSRGTYNASRAYWRANTDHPLMLGVTKVDIEEAVVGPGGETGVFDAILGEEEVTGASGYDLDAIQASLSRGWFAGAHKSWLPLLWADKQLRRPIMLVTQSLQVE